VTILHTQTLSMYQNAIAALLFSNINMCNFIQNCSTKIIIAL